MRDLFVRIDRLSVDQVERLRKRIDATSLKLEDVKQAKKDKWEEEAERLVSQIERDQATVASQLNRRVFIRAWCVILRYKAKIYASFF
jgi:sorting nexin-8